TRATVHAQRRVELPRLRPERIEPRIGVRVANARPGREERALKADLCSVLDLARGVLGTVVDRRYRNANETAVARPAEVGQPLVISADAGAPQFFIEDSEGVHADARVEDRDVDAVH